MKIYVDLIFFLNFAFDFILLLSVSLILKRNVKLRRLLFGGFLGALSIFSLLIKLSSISLFFLKVGISILMLLAAFGYRNIRYFFKNFCYLYMASIILGGFLYFLNVQFSYKNEGLVFFHNGLSINFILLLLFGPVILYVYVRQCRSMKLSIQHFHKVDLCLSDDSWIHLNGYLDTGNQLYDPYGHRPVILVYHKKFNSSYDNKILVPFSTLNEKGVIPCQKIKQMRLDGKKDYFDVLIGISKQPFQMEGVDCIIHNDYKEELG